MFLIALCPTPSFGLLRHIDVSIDEFNELTDMFPKNNFGFFDVEPRGAKMIVPEALLSRLAVSSFSKRKLLVDFVKFACERSVFLEFGLQPQMDPLSASPYQLRLANMYTDAIAIELANEFCGVLVSNMAPLNGRDLFCADELRARMDGAPAKAGVWMQERAKLNVLMNYVSKKTVRGARIMFAMEPGDFAVASRVSLS